MGLLAFGFSLRRPLGWFFAAGFAIAGIFFLAMAPWGALSASLGGDEVKWHLPVAERNRAIHELWITAGMRGVAYLASPSAGWAVDVRKVQVFLAISEFSIIGGCGIEKQVYFMALKAESILLFAKVIEELGGVWSGEEVFEKRAVDGMARGAFLFRDIAMEDGVLRTCDGRMAVIAEALPFGVSQ